MTPLLPAEIATVTLLDYVEVLRRRWRILVLTLVAVLVFTAVVTYGRTPLFRATATLIIEPDTPEIASLTGTSPKDFSRDFYETQFEIIRCNTVLQRVYDAGGLAKDPAFARAADPVRALRDRILVSPIPNSRLVRLSVEHPDRKVALRLADLLAQVYIEYNIEHRQSASRKAFEWLSGQIEQLKGKVEQSQKKLLEYKATQADAMSVEKRKGLLEDRLTSLSRDYDEILKKNLELQTTLAEVNRIRQRPELVESLPSALDSPLIQNLKQQLSELSIEMARVSPKFREKHPTVVALQNQLDIVRGRLSSEVGKIAKSIEIDYQISRAKESALRQSLDELKQDSSSLAGEAIQYGTLAREAESNQQIYDVLLKRLAEAGVGGNLTGQNVRVIDRATADPRPLKPRKRINFVVGFLAGAMLGLAAAFTVEHVDNTVKTERDLTATTGLPVLTLVPREKLGPDLVAAAPDGLRKAYVGLKGAIALYQRDHVLRTLVVTSAVRSEGKTVSAASLALAFAASGQKVLLIDADLYGPRLSKLFPVKRDVGLSDYFQKDLEPLELVQHTNVPNLDLVPAGRIPRNPAELFGSPRLRAVIESARDRYQLVIVDSPPLSASLEVALLAAGVDGVLFVVRAASTPRPLVRKVVSQLRGVQANIVGTVLTSATLRHGAAGYYYEYEQYPAAAEV